MNPQKVGDFARKLTPMEVIEWKSGNPNTGKALETLTVAELLKETPQYRNGTARKSGNRLNDSMSSKRVSNLGT